MHTCFVTPLQTRNPEKEKRRGPHKLNWKSFFHNYDDDDSGVGDDGDDDD